MFIFDNTLSSVNNLGKEDISLIWVISIMDRTLWNFEDMSMGPLFLLNFTLFQSQLFLTSIPVPLVYLLQWHFHFLCDTLFDWVVPFAVFLELNLKIFINLNVFLALQDNFVSLWIFNWIHGRIENILDSFIHVHALFNYL
jgi:hypothetical protein